MNKTRVIPIPFNGVTLSSQKNKKNLLSIFSRLIDTCNNYLDGKETRTLERNLTRYLGGGYVAAVSSGHDAIVLSLQSLKLGKHDEVIFPVNSYPTAFAIAQSGAKLVPCDVDQNGQLDPKSLEMKMSKRTKAIVIVHLYGLVGEIDQIKQVVRGKKIYVVEDCAQAFGSFYKGRPVGTLGDISCFSFYPTKNLFTLGDGGAIWTKHRKCYQYIIQAKQYGEKARYQSEFVWGHSRIPEIQAVLVNYFFRQKNSETRKKKKLESYYRKKISNMNLGNYIRPLVSSPSSNSLLHLFVIHAKDRDGLREFLAKKNIPTFVHYPQTIHLVKAFSFLGLGKGAFPMAESLSFHILSLPFHNFLTHAQIDYILNAISDYYLISFKNHQRNPQNKKLTKGM